MMSTQMTIIQMMILAMSGEIQQREKCDLKGETVNDKQNTIL